MMMIRTTAKKAMRGAPLPPQTIIPLDLVEQKLKLCIIGCGRGGSALLTILKDDPLVEIIGVADIDQRAKGIKIAKSLNIPVESDYRQLVKKDVSIIINVTGSQAIGSHIRELKSAKAELIEGVSAKLLWQLVEERRRSVKERERVLKEHEALYNLGLIIENIDSIKDTGFAIVDYATRLTSTPAGSLAIFNEQKNEMILAASKGFSNEFHRYDRWKVRKGGLTSHILNQKSPLIIPDIREYPHPNPLLIKEGVRSLMTIPLTIEGKIVGILYVNDFKKREFRAEDVSLFSLLTVYAALTIERVKSIEEMRLMSITDGLTGLYNHRYIMEQLRKEVHRSQRHRKTPFSVIMLDIDHFKDYNDKYGHLDGNKVLKKISKTMQSSARNTDIVGRFGGEEFCVILPEIKKRGAVIFARRLLKEVENSFPASRKVTISAGVAAFPGDGTSPTDIIKKADQCLYHAKRNGRNRACS